MGLCGVHSLVLTARARERHVAAMLPCCWLAALTAGPSFPSRPGVDPMGPKGVTQSGQTYNIHMVALSQLTSVEKIMNKQIGDQGL